MLTRRAFLVFSAATMAALAAHSAPALAGEDPATFVQDFGKRLTDVVNGDAPLQQKQKALRPLIDADVDVDMIARFCLGRFTNSSTPQQIAEYTRLFHSVLINNISSKIGEYRGVTFSVGSASARGPDSVVNSVVTRPNNAPNNVQWVRQHGWPVAEDRRCGCGGHEPAPDPAQRTMPAICRSTATTSTR